MSKTVVTIEALSQLEASLYEEESYSFLAANCFADWFIYSSDELGLENTKALANNFMSLHGNILFPKNELAESFWSPVPLGVFRYKMLENGKPYLVDSFKHVDGYIVEGAYWANGFVYLVRDDNKIIQIKLFIDKKTKEIQLYPTSTNASVAQQDRATDF